MAQIIGIPKGTRDFNPDQMIKRNFLFDTIKTVFQQYGYLPIETPSMENLSTLMGKYGEEGDKLLFKVLNSGNYLSRVKPEMIQEESLGKITTQIAEKGLRYDLTVPFARFVVQHRNDLTFPFKRYQIQPVWRADKPQKGRYREFFQCDVDVIGSHSLLNEVELVRMIDDVFKKLNIEIVIKLNNRKILSGIAQTIDKPEMITDLTTAIDKLDKIGLEKVYEELQQKGFSQENIDRLAPIIHLQGDNGQKLEALQELIGHTPEGSLGVTELKTVLQHLATLNIKAKVELDQSLARGLNYYTGAIIEVKAQNVQIGSICGGGRYDDLTSIFGLDGMSGVGVSFGADRIYDVMEELELFTENVHHTTQVLLVNFGEEEVGHSLLLLEKIQQAGIRAELYPDSDKLKKQMKYADQKGIPLVLLVGEEEIKSGSYNLKHMKTGLQENITIEQLIKMINISL
ncbi:MAG: histidine--tRNA ligase [Bacteroidetes bacterium GWF2_41_31]|nr:MAG: histidine--tRNA ligase [Bacteroidetes bacterium GWF2_41_31]OFZ08604.1 MAG: histidine--tRNA ligase [Bacteroidetes bacterium RIFOXYB12_FULL_41_6]